jgi:uncharacterized protein (DUF849 family)
VLLQAALNGPRTTAEHPAVPLTAAQLAEDAAACVAEGAAAIHLHPRDQDGAETLEPAVVDDVVRTVRERCGAPVGVSTGAWIEPDLERRLAHLRGWRAPDYASVNLSEEGHADVMRALLDAGVGIEAGVWTPQDAEALAASGLADRVLRVLVEPLHTPRDEALAAAQAVHDALDAHGITAPRLQHGDGEAGWVLVEDAIARRIATRVGLEDVLADPEGRQVGNAALVAAARTLGAG